MPDSKHFKVVETDINAAVKDGKVFRFFHSKEMLAGEKFKYLFIVPPNLTIGVIRRKLIALGAPCMIRIFSGFTVNAPGTTITPIKQNLVSTINSQVALSQGADIDLTGAAEIDLDFAPAASTAGNNVGTGTPTEEIILTILPPMAQFCIEVENIGSDTATMITKYNWSENPIKN